MLITVSGAAGFGVDAESSSDTITSYPDGTTTIKVNNLRPDELDSFHFDGEVTDFTVDDGYGYDVRVDGKPTTLDELASGEFDYAGTDSSDGDSSDGEAPAEDYPKSIVVDGQSADSITTYTFTVTGEIRRDVENSTSSGSGLTWSVIEDVSQDGKVMGLVADDVDVFQYSGEVTDFTVDGDAAVYMERND
jgi:hypothetical protein